MGTVIALFSTSTVSAHFLHNDIGGAVSPSFVDIAGSKQRRTLQNIKREYIFLVTKNPTWHLVVVSEWRWLGKAEPQRIYALAAPSRPRCYTCIFQAKFWRYQLLLTSVMFQMAMQLWKLSQAAMKPRCAFSTSLWGESVWRMKDCKEPQVASGRH